MKTLHKTAAVGQLNLSMDDPHATCSSLAWNVYDTLNVPNSRANLILSKNTSKFIHLTLLTEEDGMAVSWNHAVVAALPYISHVLCNLPICIA